MAKATNPIQRILVVRLGAMGDVIHALPAVAALRTLFPRAEIGWVIEERWAELLDGPQAPHARSQAAERKRSLVDTVYAVNTLSWRNAPLAGSTRRELCETIRELRRAHYDVAVDFQGAWKSAVLARFSGAPMRVGFRRPRERGAEMFYTHPVPAQGAHIVEQNLSLLAVLANPATGGFPPPTSPIRGGLGTSVSADDISNLRGHPPEAQLPVDPTQELWAEQELARLGLRGQEFAVINPGAGWGAKRWPTEHYAAVARGLGEGGLPSLINFGPAEEELARALEAASGGTAHALRCSISQLIAMTRRARLFVGGDTGPMHLAAALRVPVVAIFGPTDPARNGPFATESMVLRHAASVTNHSRRAPPDAAMLSITVSEVMKSARVLLDRTRPQTSRGGDVRRD